MITSKPYVRSKISDYSTRAMDIMKNLTSENAANSKIKIENFGRDLSALELKESQVSSSRFLKGTAACAIAVGLAALGATVLPIIPAAFGIAALAKAVESKRNAETYAKAGGIMRTDAGEVNDKMLSGRLGALRDKVASAVGLKPMKNG